MNDYSGIPEDIALQTIWKSFGIFMAVGAVLILGFYGPGRFHYMGELWLLSHPGMDVFLGAASGLLFSGFVLLLIYTSVIEIPDNTYIRLIQKIAEKKYGLFTIAAGAGVAEEFLFRGALFGVTARYAGDLPALLGVSLLFMALHIPQYRGSFMIHAVVFVMGGVLGGLFLYTGSLWTPIAAHITYNAILAFMMKKKARH
ncbi:CPBP family intramembrane glutamic endopeptidase [Salibacterium aidingense]|uniref:CPBP family intramembrane glutamic endopeptidase n=1 Tax=Salibacterium aidingense TaxID=384933 RepID=UPI00040A6AEE|nr:type II CAAX endopeptidase family protein [Salibacterium aidingense]